MKQGVLDLTLPTEKHEIDLLVSTANIEAYQAVSTKNHLQKLFIVGPKKSGKTSLCKIWQKQNNAIFIKNIENLGDLNNNIIIDQYENYSELEVVNAINAIDERSFKILITAEKLPLIKLPDLKSRIKSIYKFYVKHPDDILARKLITKLFQSNQLIISDEILEKILEYTENKYSSIFSITEHIDLISKIRGRKLTKCFLDEILSDQSS